MWNWRQRGCGERPPSGGAVRTSGRGRARLRHLACFRARVALETCRLWRCRRLSPSRHPLLRLPLLHLALPQVVELLPSRIRRRFASGLTPIHMGLVKRMRKAKKDTAAPGPNQGKPIVVKTHLRDLPILPEMVRARERFARGPRLLLLGPAARRPPNCRPTYGPLFSLSLSLFFSYAGRLCRWRLQRQGLQHC